MDARKSPILALEFVKPILETITHLMLYTVIEIQFRSVNGTAVTAGYVKISSTSIPSH